jgi:hypothetical protein
VGVVQVVEADAVELAALGYPIEELRSYSGFKKRSVPHVAA